MPRSIACRLSAIAALLAGCALAPSSAHLTTASLGPRTRAESSAYTETSSHADVMVFVDALARLAPASLSIDTLGRSTEGRVIPLVIASRPGVRTVEAARATGRPLVWVQGNIHAGEVEGKEALQAVLRDLALARSPNVLDSIVLLAVPIYNADGNERLGPQARNRSEQNGPALVGQRPNGQGLDLNRDYIKAEAPETRASLAAFARWDPDVFVDLHTTNGSYHGYALTYSPSLHPAAPLGAWTADTLLPILRRRMRDRHRFETFDYGNFTTGYGDDVGTDTTKRGWWTYEHVPRFGTNYYGLRNRVAILSEAYSHDPFARRVAATDAFVREVLSLAAEHGAELRRRGRDADSSMSLGRVAEVTVAAQLTRNGVMQPVIAEDLVADPDSVPDEPGVPRGLRRSGRYRTLSMPTHLTFDARSRVRLPDAWIIPPALDTVARLLQAHGIGMRHLERDTLFPPLLLDRIDSLVVANRPFQGHRLVRLVTSRGLSVQGDTVPAGAWIVPSRQRLGALAAVLLSASSDDGVATWGLLGDGLRVGGMYPVAQVAPWALQR